MLGACEVFGILVQENNAITTQELFFLRRVCVLLALQPCFKGTLLAGTMSGREVHVQLLVEAGADLDVKALQAYYARGRQRLCSLWIQ